MYKLIHNIDELEETCYFEFLPGKYKNKCWNKESIYLEEDSIALFEHKLEEINPYFDHFEFTDFSLDQIRALIREGKKTTGKP